MAANPDNLYSVLGISRDAEVDAIKKAYRRLAQQYHPDHNPDDPNAEERFKAISQAYAVLSDPERRANYDEFGDIALDPSFDASRARSFGGPFAGARGGFDSQGGMGGFSSLFEELFRGQQGTPFQSRPQRGNDLESELELDFMEAARGAERQISVGRPRREGGSRVDTLTIRIPAGIADGARIRLGGKGEEGRNGGPPGDLFARIRVREHDFFVREGQDLHLEVPVSIAEATLGADVEIPTLEGRVTLHIPEGTDGGSRLRLRGKGLPANGRRKQGDLYVTVQIRVATDLDETERDALRALRSPDLDAVRRERLD